MTFAKSFLSNQMLTMIASHMALLGHTAEYRMLGTQLVITDDPGNIKAIMSTSFGDWGKGKVLKGIWQQLLGNSIFTSMNDASHVTAINLLKLHSGRTCLGSAERIAPTSRRSTPFLLSHIISI